MPVNNGREDIRNRKTEKALGIALSSLLESRNFGKITVKDICGEALISRASFYAHFLDKYDLLKTWLKRQKTDNIYKGDIYEKIEKTVNEFVYNNKRTIKNIAYDADKETLDILCDFMLSSLSLTGNKNNYDKMYSKQIVLTNFLGGGLVNYLLWLINNQFPSDVAPMNIHLYKIIKMFQEWQSE